MHNIDDRFEFAHTEDVTTIGVHNIYIVDEADLTAERFISFDGAGNLNGLFNLTRASKVFFFSATIPKYFKDLFNSCIGKIADKQWLSQY